MDVSPIRRSRKKALAWGGVALLVLAAAAAGWHFFLRPPDLTIYDSEIRSAVATAETAQEALEDLQDPGDLPGFAESLEAGREELGDAGTRTRALGDETHRLALLEVIKAEDSVLKEMERLASLPSASIDESEFSSLPDLIDELNASYAAAVQLRSLAGIPSNIDLDHRVLERTLYDLAAYREEIIAERARVTKRNKARARELAATKTFLGEFDGIVSRYAGSRTELSDWVEQVTNNGGTFMEAYQTLDQQQARRVALRDELAALEAPAAFSTAKTELLGIMDTAIDAMGAASRGMTEFQFDWSYWDFRDTPGWRQFESATTDITDRFSATLSRFEQTRDSVLKKLKKKEPLPELPE